jgi:hypothetical protein
VSARQGHTKFDQSVIKVIDYSLSTVVACIELSSLTLFIKLTNEIASIYHGNLATFK